MADPSTSPPLTRASVLAARELIAPFVHHTPTVTNATLTALASAGLDGDDDIDDEGGDDKGAAARRPPRLRLYFKCENLQRVGAFKARGAFHALERLKREPGWRESGGMEKGVVTHSSGNHAQALSLAARDNGIPAYVVMPSIAPPSKIAATKGYGARVTFSGSTAAEREAVTARVMAETGARLVPPYDHPDIVLGQGTLGLELQEDAARLIAEGAACSFATTKTAASTTATTTTEEEEEEEEDGEKKTKKKKKKGLDVILAPCGGGGMLSGVALACEGTGIRVYGCEPSFEGADDGKRGFEAGARVEGVRSLTVADGLRTQLGRVPWSVIYERRLVRGFFAVPEAAIVAALRLVFERCKMVVEPSAAVPLAVALFDPEFRALAAREAGPDGWDVGIVLSGGNVSLDALGRLFADDDEPSPAA